MMVDNGDCDLRGTDDPGAFCRQVLSLCHRRGYQGVVLHWANLPCPGLNELTAALEAQLRETGLSCYVPYHWGKLLPQPKLLLPTALSGGSLRGWIGEGQDAFGPRVVPFLAPWAQRFSLPASGGRGREVTADQLARLLATLRPQVRQCPQLCAKYFSWAEQGHPQLVIFDDEETLAEKKRVLEAMGIAEWMLG
jgi:hypothetical protein